MAESLLNLPLTALMRIAEATGTRQVMIGCIWLVFPALLWLWVAIFLGRERTKHPSRCVDFFLIAVVGFPVFASLVETVFVGLWNDAPLVNRQLAVVQSYFCLSALTYCEAYWNKRNRDAYFTALLTTAMACLIWTSVALFWAAMSI